MSSAEAPASGSLRCAMIGSGSAGNATLVMAGDTAVLIDCGYSIKAFEERAAELGFDPASLTAILVTHEHDDHAGGVDALARKYDIPVHATRGTRVATEARIGALPHWQELSAHAGFRMTHANRASSSSRQLVCGLASLPISAVSRRMSSGNTRPATPWCSNSIMIRPCWRLQPIPQN